MIIVIGKIETCIAFGLTGVHKIIDIDKIADENQLKNIILKLNPAIIIVDEYAYDKHENLFDSLRDKYVIVEIPTYNYKGKFLERVKRLMKKVFGIEVKI